MVVPGSGVSPSGVGPKMSDDEDILHMQRELEMELNTGMSHDAEVELERAKMVAQFGKRCDAFRRYEEKLERRAKAAERLRKRDQREVDDLTSSNQKLMDELSVARAYIETLQRIQRERFEDSLRCEEVAVTGVVSPCSDMGEDWADEESRSGAMPPPPPPLPRAGVGLVDGAVAVEVAELRRQAVTMTRELQRPTPSPWRACSF